MLCYVKHVMLFTKTKTNPNCTLFKSSNKLYFKNTNTNNGTQNTKFSDNEMWLHTAGRPAHRVRTTMLLSLFSEVTPDLILRILNGLNNSPLLHTPIMFRILTI